MQRDFDVEKTGSAELDEEVSDFSPLGAIQMPSESIFIEQPFSNNPETHPVNGNYAPDDEDEDEQEEDDLILGDGDEALGNEEEFDVELDDDFDEEDIDEDDLVIDADDDVDEDDDL
ncbi:MAG TPA: hypothetical protein VNR87_16110 [Flavisolibacter sp.]|nr:hypothetical protein [Flavisolibacter sp.]